MKKFFAVIALVAFLGGISAPVIAQNNETVNAIELADKDPKKAEKKSEKKSDSECTDAKAKKSESKECEKKCEGKK